MCRLQDPESSNECHRICGLKCLPQETAEAIALDLQADILSDCNEDSVDENNGGEDSGDSGCDDESGESEAVVRPPPYAEVAEEFRTLEAK